MSKGNLDFGDIKISYEKKIENFPQNELKRKTKEVFQVGKCFRGFYPILSYPILSYPILSYPILSYPILSYPILSYPILSHPILLLKYCL